MMKSHSSLSCWFGFAAAVGSLALAGCTGDESVVQEDTSASALAAPTEGSAEARIEAAVRDIESGRNFEAARGALEQVIENPASTSDQRDDAGLALSRLHEIEGDQQAAIETVEKVLASHPLGSRFAARDRAHRRLRFLLTGSETEPSRPPAEEEVAPIAKVLARHFAEGPDGTTKVNLLLFGRPPETGADLGTFRISGALRDNKREACPLCDDGVSVHTSRSQHSSWVAIPTAAAGDPDQMPTLSSSLTVFYYDLRSNRIPSRYDDFLPLPSKEIAAHIEKGQGLVAVKTRDAAPPVVLIAAPRWALLPDVEAAFAQMTSLPSEPTPVTLSLGLRQNEIRAGVRAIHPELRACYENHLKSVPDARGKMVISFAIDGQGSVREVEPTAASTLADPALQQCFREAFGEMELPAIGKETTVTYPIALSPSR